ncbi:PACE efflux transporter [Piscinibacter sp.]|uniref:PACE efflux transporter n=1 Tax=Piscinibacter sp. TaxID=1903157 RepID=UPI0039E4F131
MSPTTRRRVVQAILYEVFAIAFVGPAMSLMFGQSAGSTLALAVVMSTIALGWNYVFNGLFEAWESRQAVKGRSFGRRLAHGIGFEGGLVFLLVPVMAYWLETTLLKAFLADLGILAFFFVYAIVFTWAFDRVFGLPQSASPPCEA